MRETGYFRFGWMMSLSVPELIRSTYQVAESISMMPHESSKVSNDVTVVENVQELICEQYLSVI